MGKLVRIESFANTTFKKCECCDRNKDLYFQATIYDHKSPDRIIGGMKLCKDCGINLGAILDLDVSAERTKNEFKFFND